MVINIAQKMLNLANAVNGATADRCYKKSLKEIKERARYGAYFTYIIISQDEELIREVSIRLANQGFRVRRSEINDGIRVAWGKSQ